MPKFPSDPSLPTLPGTIPINSRLRLISPHSAFLDDDPAENSLLMASREQLLRAKHLLLQLKQIHSLTGLSVQQSALSKDLAMLRLTIRSLESGDLTTSQLSDIRLVLDEVSRLIHHQGFWKRNDDERERRRVFLTNWFENAIGKDLWPLEEVRLLAGQLYREFLSLAPPLWWYRATPEEPFRWAASHGLNTAQVIQRMLHPAQHSSIHIHNAILAGLLHDLGMARLPVRVLAAQEKTNTTTRQQWRSHAVWLAERVRPQLRPEEFDVAVAIAQHHERLDGNGYPAKLKSTQIVELGRQLAVADAYAALCQARPHRDAMPTRQATTLVLQEAKLGRLDMLAAISLLPWGLAPVGSNVELSDGTLAEVISWDHIQSGSHSLRPVVALSPRQENETILDLDLVRDRHIVRIVDSEMRNAG